ncbi:MAG: hypothetical protein V4492_07280 [Chlamydiota bacterium]
MRSVPLLFSFFLALTASLFGTLFFPHIRLLTFSPFLALTYNRTSLVSAMWIASMCGLILDLTSSELRIGTNALNFCITTLFLYRQKKHFFEDKLLALSLFTALISTVSTVVQLFLSSIFGRAFRLTVKLLFTDLIAMPLVDAVYAFLWFSCPILLYAHCKRVGLRHILAQLRKLLPKIPKRKTGAGSD